MNQPTGAATDANKATIEEQESDVNDDYYEDPNNHYDYSDSDFEDNLEQRLKDMSTNTDSFTDDELDHSEGNKLTKITKQPHNVEDEDLYKDLELALSADEEEDAYEDEEEEEEEYQPLPPPQELDPDKLYALYEFNGPDSSHCQLKQDEACILLNDQDSYWWLVKRCSDNKIGFAPAEILETFPERLARLNCWKNENMSSRSLDIPNEVDDNNKKPNAKDNTEETSNTTPSFETNDNNSKSATEDSLSPNDELQTMKPPGLKDYKKGNKSVSFNDVVSFAERYIDEDTHNECGDELPKHHDEFSEERLDFNDELSDTVSDVSSSGPTAPLNIKKTRQYLSPDVYLDSKATDTQNTQSLKLPSPELLSEVPITSTKEAVIEPENTDELHKVFEVPIRPFDGNKNNGIQNSNSNYSISSIGEFSPSSSEWTEESPKQQDTEIDNIERRDTIPSIKAVSNIANFIKSNGENDPSTPQDSQPGSVNIETKKIAGKTVPLQIEKIEKIISEDAANNPPEETHSNPSSSPSASSVGDFSMGSHRVLSTTSINSTLSTSKTTDREETTHNQTSSTLHPKISQLYSPMFNKMDNLMKQLDEIIQK